jgi:hypothetical protein
MVPKSLDTFTDSASLQSAYVRRNEFLHIDPSRLHIA